MVIPKELRERHSLKKGEKFLVFGNRGEILLKRLERPNPGEIQEMFRKAEKRAEEKRLKQKDVEDVIRDVRSSTRTSS